MPSALDGNSELLDLLKASNTEVIVSRYLASEPWLERERFSGGLNVSARERNERRMREACKVFTVASVPGKLFVAPWVNEVLMAGLAEDADDRIDVLCAKLHRATGRNKLALSWKVETAERMRAGQMSRYFWKRNAGMEKIMVMTLAKVDAALGRAGAARG